MTSWLEPELEQGLRTVTAPAELWDRIHAPQPKRSSASRGFVWAAAAAVVVMTVGLSVVQRRNVVKTVEPQRFGDHCENPAELRAYAIANPGLEVVSRSVRVPLRVSVQQNSLTCNLCHLD
jgi:hypothetical protein